MKRNLIIVGLVAALAIPTASFAAGHRSSHKGRSASAAAAPKTNAKGSAPRSGVTLRFKPSKNVPASARTKAWAKPKARTRSGRKPKANASAGHAKTSVRVKRNMTAGTPAVGVTLHHGGGSGASGKQGIGGLALPISPGGASL